MKCPNCGSETYIKRGFQLNFGEKKQRYQCKECGKIFLEPKFPEQDDSIMEFAQASKSTMSDTITTKHCQEIEK